MHKELKKLADATGKNIEYCNWVRKQKIDDYFKHLESEIKELKTAIRNDNRENIKEELGDVLWDAVMLAKIAECNAGISSKEVVSGVIEKFRRRKPYIFECRSVSRKEAHEMWRKAKKKEKANANSRK